jgi:hypothetical protein
MSHEQQWVASSRWRYDAHRIGDAKLRQRPHRSSNTLDITLLVTNTFHSLILLLQLSTLIQTQSPTTSQIIMLSTTSSLQPRLSRPSSQIDWLVVVFPLRLSDYRFNMLQRIEHTPYSHSQQWNIHWRPYRHSVPYSRDNADWRKVFSYCNSRLRQNGDGGIWPKSTHRRSWIKKGDELRRLVNRRALLTLVGRLLPSAFKLKLSLMPLMIEGNGWWRMVVSRHG